MTLVHIVLFKFGPEADQAHRDNFLREAKKLKDLPSVKDGRLIISGPSVTDPIERSKGFEYALVSYHEDRAKFDEYQKSPEHDALAKNRIFPFIEDLCRFDFEVDPAEEYLCDFGMLARMKPSADA